MDALGAKLLTPSRGLRLRAADGRALSCFQRHKQHGRCSRGSALAVRAFVPHLEGRRLDTFPRELEYSAVSTSWR